MQKIVIEEPYRFVRPYQGKIWGEIFRPILPTYLRLSHNIVDVECRNLERLRKCVDEGYGVLLAPNHCRLSDPMTMGWIVREAGIHIYTMASWHLFKQDGWFDRLSAWMMRRLGAFSILREGTDRLALTTAIDILADAERPLVVFPEGVVSRANDRLGPLMDGVAFIARMAARRAGKKGRPGVVILPVAIRYVLLDDIEPAVSAFVDEVEARLTWLPDSARPLVERIERICEMILVLKEMRYFGHTCQGPFEDRRRRLIQAILSDLEREWVIEGASNENTITRVKEIRAAILSRLLDESVPATEKEHLRRRLVDAYIAQQLHFHTSGYVGGEAPPEHLLETVERIEEDLTDSTSNHGRLRVIMEIGEPIPVPAEREKRRGQAAEADPLMEELSNRLAAMLEESGREVAESRNGGDQATTIVRDTSSVSGM